jgi:hypothetical protein
VIAVTGWWMLAPGRDADRLTKVRTILSLMEEETEAEPAAGDGELEALARQLLELEGLAADESLDLEFPDVWFSQDAEPRPTALRFRNSAGPPARRYG